MFEKYTFKVKKSSCAFKNKVLTKALYASKNVACYGISQERRDRRGPLVSPENELATQYEMKTNNRMKSKLEHTEFELS